MSDPEALLSAITIPDARRTLLRERLMFEMGKSELSVTPRRRHRRRLATVAFGTAAASAAALGVIALQLTPAAAWSPRPGELSATAADQAASACTRAIHAAGPAGLFALPSGDPVVLAERRGTSTSVILGFPTTIGECVGTAANRLVGVLRLDPPLPGSPLVVDNDGGKLTPPGAVRVVIGRVAPTVAVVQVDTADGRKVLASVRGGFFLAWWPSGSDPTTVTAIDSTGKVKAVVRPAGTVQTPTQKPTP